jgi:hypothetical protein
LLLCAHLPHASLNPAKAACKLALNISTRGSPFISGGTVYQAEHMIKLITSANEPSQGGGCKSLTLQVPLVGKISCPVVAPWCSSSWRAITVKEF